MTTDQQVKLLMSLIKKGLPLAAAACVSSPASRHQPSLNGFSSTSAGMPGASIRHIRAGRRQRATPRSDPFPHSPSSPPCAPRCPHHSAGMGGCWLAPGFWPRTPVCPAQSGRFRCPDDEGPGQLASRAASFCRRSPGLIPARRIASLT
jgi:hypothetical protein